ncbi:polysaccharide deacetylase family protein, partial [Streptomyces sp. NPDC003015]
HDAGGDRSQSVRALRDYLPQLIDSGYHITVPRRQYV